MSSDKPLRVFIAASVPEDELAWLRERTAGLKERWPQARWAAAENQHVTLKFLGSTPPDRLEGIVAACGSVAGAVAPSEIRLGGLGVFPSPKRARVLWTGLEDPAEILTTVAGGLDRALAPLGYEPEKRRFTPHLTLARFREPVRIESLPRLPEPPEWFPLAGFGLWRSHLSPRGARYELLRDFAFGHSK